LEFQRFVLQYLFKVKLMAILPRRRRESVPELDQVNQAVVPEEVSHLDTDHRPDELNPFDFVESQAKGLAQSTEHWGKVAQTVNGLRSQGDIYYYKEGLREVYRVNKWKLDERKLDNHAFAMSAECPYTGF
jgi:hypothetical protein